MQRTAATRAGNGLFPLVCHEFGHYTRGHIRFGAATGLLVLALLSVNRASREPVPVAPERSAHRSPAVARAQHTEWFVSRLRRLRRAVPA